MVNQKTTKWWYFAALLMFVAATFQIASDLFLLGMVLLVMAGLISAAAGIDRRYVTEEKRQNNDIII